MLSETDFEILWFEDRFWWPLTDDFNPEMYPHSGVGVREFLDDLTGGRDFFGLNPAGERVFDLATTNKVIATSKIEQEDRDEVIARLQRAVAERILVVGDAVYALGGEPVYIERRLHGRTKDVTVVSLHPDRTVERGSPLGPYPGYMEFADKYLERRAFHLAGEMGPVRTAAARIGMPENMMPTIEAVMPRVNSQSRDDIHADALFRFAVDGRRPWHEDRAGSEGIADVVAIMKSLGGRRTNSETTTGDRFEALVMLKRAIEADESHLKRCTDFRYLDLHLKPLAASLAPHGDFLAPEDEEALDGL